MLNHIVLFLENTYVYKTIFETIKMARVAGVCSSMVKYTRCSGLMAKTVLRRKLWSKWTFPLDLLHY